MTNRHYYWDKETREFKEGFPPPVGKIYGQAPYIILDGIKPYYHPAVEKWTSSRSELDAFDKVSGTITTDKMQAPDKSFRINNDKTRRKDSTEALHRAVAAVDSGEAPLSEETKKLCEIQNEIVSSALNFDAFNVAGRKTNAKGKRFRGRR